MLTTLVHRSTGPPASGQAATPDRHAPPSLPLCVLSPLGTLLCRTCCVLSCQFCNCTTACQCLVGLGVTVGLGPPLQGSDLSIRRRLTWGGTWRLRCSSFPVSYACLYLASCCSAGVAMYLVCPVCDLQPCHVNFMQLLWTAQYCPGVMQLLCGSTHQHSVLALQYLMPCSVPTSLFAVADTGGESPD